MVKRRKLDHQSSSDAQTAPPLSAAAALRVRQKQSSDKGSNAEPAFISPGLENPSGSETRRSKKSTVKARPASSDQDASISAGSKQLSAAREKPHGKKAPAASSTGLKPLSAVEARRRALEDPAQVHTDSVADNSDNSVDSYEPDYLPRPEDGDDSVFPSSTTLQSGDERLEAAHIPPSVEMSSWTPTVDKVLKHNASGMTVRLPAGQTLALIGQYDLLVKRGVITLYGAILRAGPQAQSYRVFAPASHALPVIYCLSPDGAEAELRSVSSELGSLQRVSPLHGRLWKAPGTSDSSFLRNHKKRWSFDNIHRLSDDPLGRPLYHVEIAPKWHQAIDKICSAMSKSKPSFFERILVCGPKSSGKSTFSRMLLNRLFTIDREAMKAESHSIFLLDLDPGQPEYSPPGQVSLIELRQPIFGPPFGHPSATTGTNQRTMRAHFIGATSPKDNPEHYVDCAADLLTHYHKHLAFGATRGPLIINSPGWTIGTGLQILTDLIVRLGLTDVVYTSDEPGRTPDALQQAVASAAVDRFHAVPSQPSGPPTRSAAECRDMQMLSYFHLGAPQQGSPHQKWDATPLTARAPYVVSYRASEPDLLAVMALGEAVPPEDLAIVLDGSVVGIVLLEQPLPPNNPPSSILHTPRESLPYLSAGTRGHIEPPDPRTSHLVGLALVRGIDVPNQTLHLVTPAANDYLIEELQPDRTVLVLGMLGTPGWAYMQDIHLAAHQRALRQRREQGVGDGDAATDDEGDASMGEGKDEGGEADVPETGIPWVQKESGEGVGVVGMKRRLRRFQN